MAASDVCLVHLKRRDLFRTVLPSKLLEALAMAKPVVLGVEGCAADLLRQSGGGIGIEPDNADQLIQAIDAIQAEPARAREMGRRGRNYVLQHFDWDHLATQYLDVLERQVKAVQPLKPES